MTELPAPKAPKGWYTDPSGESRDRYWDGNYWTERTEPHAGRTEPTMGAKPVEPAATLKPTANTTDKIDPGWFVDRSDDSKIRYWDGEAWTGTSMPLFSPRENLPPRTAQPLPRAIESKNGRGLAITSLVLSIVGYFALYSYWSPLFALVAMTFGIFSLARKNRGTGMAIAGLALGTLCLFVSLLILGGVTRPGY